MLSAPSSGTSCAGTVITASSVSRARLLAAGRPAPSSSMSHMSDVVGHPDTVSQLPDVGTVVVDDVRTLAFRQALQQHLRHDRCLPYLHPGRTRSLLEPDELVRRGAWCSPADGRVSDGDRPMPGSASTSMIPGTCRASANHRMADRGHMSAATADGRDHTSKSPIIRDRPVTTSPGGGPLTWHIGSRALPGRRLTGLRRRPPSR